MAALREGLNGVDFKTALMSAESCLERYRDVINALNVFPVPDGDTGTNMLLTMRSGLAACDNLTDATLSSVCTSMAEGLFMGARGNSGVILAQFFRGFISPLKGKEVCCLADLVAAFQQATESAYQAVGQPVEGTMLSVIRAVSESVRSQGEADDVNAVWQQAFCSAREALALTPSQLPVLSEAGVVDAGGMGMVAIIGGIWSQLSGQDPETLDLGADFLVRGVPTVNRVFVNASHEATWGYCIQLMIHGEGLLVNQVREDLGEFTDSVVVVGDEACVRVHVHALDPGPALSHAVALGQLSQIQIENMSQQNRGWSGSHPTPAAPNSQVSGIALVAVAPGKGFEQLFRESGCAAVISGGQTMNPSIQQILDAASESGGEDVILLPNNKNIVLAAGQATKVEAGQANLHVVPTVTVPQGVAATLAFNPEESIEHNLQAMTAAMHGLVTIEVAKAVHDARLDGIVVKVGQFIGLIDGKMVVAALTPEAALLKALITLSPTADMIVTLYWGAESSQEECEKLAAAIERLTPVVQVDTLFGGQPHYPYLASLE